MKFNKYLLFSLLILILAASGNSCYTSTSEAFALQYRETQATSQDKQSYYLKHNLYFSDPRRFARYINTSVTNLNSRFIPANTEVTILRVTDTYIKFRLKKPRKFYALINQMEFSHQDIETIFKRTFSETPVAVTGSTPRVTKYIEEGFVVDGMSKAEVILAYGYPNIRKTGSLENDTWIYQAGKLRTTKVFFQDGKVMQRRRNMRSLSDDRLSDRPARAKRRKRQQPRTVNEDAGDLETERNEKTTRQNKQRYRSLDDDEDALAPDEDF